MFFQACLDGIDAPFSKDNPSVNKVIMCMDLRLQNTGKHLKLRDRIGDNATIIALPASPIAVCETYSGAVRGGRLTAFEAGLS